MPKREFSLPDLSNLYAKNILNVSLDALIGGPSIVGHPDIALWYGLVRLTDKAIVEYESARVELTRWSTGPANLISPMFRAIDHLENSVTATHRGILHAKALRKRGHGRGTAQATLRQERVLRLFRNHVEHMDDKLLRGQVRQGEVHMINPLERRMEIGRQGLLYRDLASTIVKLYRTVEKVRGVPGK